MAGKKIEWKVKSKAAFFRPGETEPYAIVDMDDCTDEQKAYIATVLNMRAINALSQMKQNGLRVEMKKNAPTFEETFPALVPLRDADILEEAKINKQKTPQKNILNISLT